MLENSFAGLVMLDGEVSVTVTHEEHHQAALSRYAVAPGLQRQVAVELTWCTITSGKYRGERAIEVRLDGYRVGELTHLMTQRYAPLVAQLSTRGARAGCAAVVQLGNRGLEILLRLPRNGNAVIPLAPPAVAPAPIPIQAHSSSQAPKWIAAAVVALIFIAALASTGNDDDKPTPAAQIGTSTSTYEPTSTPSSTTTTSPTTTVPTTTTIVPPAPVTQPPQPVQPAPQPPVAQPKPQCDPNYSGCVPIASDVDCAGGSGNGPAYVSGPIRVTGSDIYGLDNDKDGTACE